MKYTLTNLRVLFWKIKKNFETNGRVLSVNSTLQQPAWPCCSLADRFSWRDPTNMLYKRIQTLRRACNINRSLLPNMGGIMTQYDTSKTFKKKGKKEKETCVFFSSEKAIAAKQSSWKLFWTWTREYIDKPWYCKFMQKGYGWISILKSCEV